jgi:UrcA family protein
MNTNTIRTTRHIVLTAIVALGLGTVAAAAQAGEAAQGVPTRVVHYADLDLGTPAGEAALHARIRYAADEVCGEQYPQVLKLTAVVKACVNRAVAAGEGAVNKARLVRVNTGHAV